eukprot:scaffold2319_cov105-Isochrysis_galbana.AAC.3
MDSVSHGSGGIDPPPERQSTARHIRDFPSFYRRHPQSTNFRNTGLRFCKYLKLPAFDRSSKGCAPAPATSSRTAHSPDLDAIYPELVASADGSITAADVEKRQQARALQMHKSEQMDAQFQLLMANKKGTLFGICICI